MFFTDYSSERTKRGELMDKETPLIDYAAPTRRTDDDLCAVNIAHKVFVWLGVFAAVLFVLWLAVEKF